MSINWVATEDQLIARLEHQAAQRARETRERQLDTERRRKVVVRWDRHLLLWTVRCQRCKPAMRGTTHTHERAMETARAHILMYHSAPLSDPVASVKL